MFENGQPRAIAQTGPTILAYFYMNGFFRKVFAEKPRDHMRFSAQPQKVLIF